MRFKRQGSGQFSSICILSKITSKLQGMFKFSQLFGYIVTTEKGDNY